MTAYIVRKCKYGKLCAQKKKGFYKSAAADSELFNHAEENGNAQS